MATSAVATVAKGEQAGYFLAAAALAFLGARAFVDAFAATATASCEAGGKPTGPYGCDFFADLGATAGVSTGALGLTIAAMYTSPSAPRLGALFLGGAVGIFAFSGFYIAAGVLEGGP